MNTFIKIIGGIIIFFFALGLIGSAVSLEDPKKDEMKWSIYAQFEPVAKSNLRNPSTYRNGLVSLFSNTEKDEANFYLSYYGSNLMGVEKSFSISAKVDYDLETMTYTIIKIY